MAAETLLSSVLGLLSLGLLLPARLTGAVGSLNLEELSEMRYGIQILPLPVMGGQVRAVGARVLCKKKGLAHGEGGRAGASRAPETKGVEKGSWCAHGTAGNRRRTHSRGTWHRQGWGFPLCTSGPRVTVKAPRLRRVGK